MSKSIMQDRKVCWRTGTTYDLHKHHIYGGVGRRKLSERYGCWVYLTAHYHNMSNQGVHFDHEFDLRLKQECQRRFQEVYPDLNFVQIFGRNYL